MLHEMCNRVLHDCTVRMDRDWIKLFWTQRTTQTRTTLWKAYFKLIIAIVNTWSINCFGRIWVLLGLTWVHSVKRVTVLGSGYKVTQFNNIRSDQLIRTDKSFQVCKTMSFRWNSGQIEYNFWTKKAKQITYILHFE